MDYRTLIIDLRGNGGGNDKKAYEVAKVLIGNQFQRPQKMKYTMITAEAKAVALNRTRFTITKLGQSGKRVPDYLVSNEKSLKNEFELAMKETSSEAIEIDHFSTDLPVLENARFDGSIFVLVDAATGSTGELMALALRNGKNVKLVGENTAGNFYFGNAGFLILPYSKIRISLPVTYKQYRMQGLKEKEGITPDIPVPKGMDAMEYVKTCLIGSNCSKSPSASSSLQN